MHFGKSCNLESMRLGSLYILGDDVEHGTLCILEPFEIRWSFCDLGEFVRLGRESLRYGILDLVRLGDPCIFEAYAIWGWMTWSLGRIGISTSSRESQILIAS